MRSHGVLVSELAATVDAGIMDADGESFTGAAGSPEGPFRRRRLSHRTSRAAAQCSRHWRNGYGTCSPREVILHSRLGSVLNKHTPFYHPHRVARAEAWMV